MYVKFNRNYLKQNKITFNHGKIVNIYILHEITKNYLINTNYPIIKNSLFGEVGFIKSKTIDELKFFGYGTGFDSKGTLSHPSGGVGRNVLIFGVDMSCSVHSDNKRGSTLVLGEGLTQSSIMQQKCTLLILLKLTKKFVQVCTLTEAIVIYLLMAQKLLNLKLMNLK